MEIWFTSDTHFCHQREFLWGPRGFTNVEEMNEAIIKNWNDVIQPDDVVYHLGDVIMGELDAGIPLVKRLNGKIKLAIGNHDTTKRLAAFKELFDEINKELASGNSVFVDQTSLTKKSRKWLLDHVVTNNCNHINLIWIDENLKTCLERNEQRKGTRGYVPRESIVNMYNNFEEPSLDEGFYRIFKYNSTNDEITYKGVIL